MGISRNIRDRLVAIERELIFNSSAVKAATYIPEQIQPHQLPLFVNMPAGRASRVQTGDTFYQITRVWNIQAWIVPASDKLRSQNEETSMDLVDAVYDHFVSRPRLELNGQGLTNVVAGLLTGDSDIQVDSYPFDDANHTKFYMVEFTMDVTYRSICL